VLNQAGHPVKGLHIAILGVSYKPGVDHGMVLTRARLVVDLRGITRGTLVQNVVRL
jgi:UDP-N-acetyl-D-mannosaminuronate dehydrogenase